MIQLNNCRKCGCKPKDSLDVDVCEELVFQIRCPNDPFFTEEINNRKIDGLTCCDNAIYYEFGNEDKSFDSIINKINELVEKWNNENK